MRVPFRGCPAVTAAGAPSRFATTGDPKSPNIINHSARAPVELFERDLGYGGRLPRLWAGRLSAERMTGWVKCGDDPPSGAAVGELNAKPATGRHGRLSGGRTGAAGAPRDRRAFRQPAVAPAGNAPSVELLVCAGTLYLSARQPREGDRPGGRRGVLRGAASLVDRDARNGERHLALSQPVCPGLPARLA